MEEHRDHSTADDDDEDYRQFAKQGKRSKRLVISDDEEEADSCDVAAAANGEDGDARETYADDGPLVSSTASSTGPVVDSTVALFNGTDSTVALSDGADSTVALSNGAFSTVALSDGADSDNESVQYDVADLQGQEVGRQSSASTSVVQSLRLGWASDDIFDDEVSNGDGSNPGLGHEDTCTDVRDDKFNDIDNSSDDDVSKESDENQVDPSLMAKLKRMKGASKSGQKRQKYARKAKPKAEEMLEIYSESQRLLRDSRVNLPYHEPEPKQLKDFLARADQKKQEYAGLRRAKDIQKAQIICNRLSLSAHLLPSANKQRARPKCQSDRSPAKTAASDCQLDHANNLHPSLQTPSLNCSSERLVSPVKNAGINSVEAGGDDELPDLLPGSTSKDCLGSVPETACHPKSVGTQATDTGISTDDISHQIDGQVSIPLLRKDPSRDLFRSQNSTIDEQPHSPHGQDRDLQICGIVDTNSTLDNFIGDSSSSLCLNGSDSTSVRETIESTVSVHVAVDCMDDSSVEHDSSVGHTCTADAAAECSLLSSVSMTPCSESAVGKVSHSSSVTPCSESAVGKVSHSSSMTPCSESAVGKVSDSSSGMTPVGRPARHKLLDRLQGISLAVSPSLTATPDGVICLDDSDPSPVVKTPGLMKLMTRLVEHSKNSTTPVTGRILDDRKDPVTACIVETGEAVETSGYKLDRLKQQLGFGMREKRAEARRRRYDQFALDNEEGFGEEEEEEEMESDGSDTDTEEEAEAARPSDSGEEREDNSSEDEEGLDDDCKIDMQANDSDDDDYNPYLDTEAHDDDDDEQDKSSDVCLHFDVSDEEEHTLQEAEADGQNKLDTHARNDKNNIDLSTSEEDNGDESRDTVILPTRERRLSSNLLESDDDSGDDVTNEPEKSRPDSTNKRKDVVSSLRHRSSETSPLTALLKDTSKQIAFRRENSESPDLYSARLEDQNVSSRSQLSSFADTNIKYMDDDGFFTLNESQQTSKVFRLPRTQNNDSGQGSQMFETCPMSAGHIFHGLATQDFDKGDNHIVSSALSSGTFVPCTGDNQFSFEDDDDDVLDPFHVLSGAEEDVAHKHPEKKEKAVLTDSDDDANSDAEDDGDDDADSDVEDDGDGDLQCDTDDKEKERSQMTELKKKRTYRMTDFVEDEAELSGSDYDSDENVDVAEEDDILEEEAGDLDLQGVSEEKLRDEVGRLHMKRLRDDDDRALMRYKEMYLQDGDLYSEGVGRIRNFRWKDVDYQSDQEKLGHNSDDDQAEDEAEDALWRKDRFEREKFLEEKDLGPATDGGQLIQLGQVFLQKQELIPQATENVTVSSLAKPSLPKPQQLKKKGSFLSRGKASLGKIAEVVQTTHGGHASKNSRNFLFQTVDGPKDEDGKTDQPQPAVAGKRKAHTSCTPEAGKRAKLADTASAAAGGRPGQPQRQSSIFDLFKDV